ncbi:MAG: bifunctional 5,10-methylenetetrahydrofolate dehydrogenase/5,10-methenyltetrahydrofolate cyclohydrolase [Patescibacteria group bacterium]
MIILDGKKLAKKELSELKEEFQKFKRDITLVIIRVGHDPVSERFVAHKKKIAETLGITVLERVFDEKILGKKLRGEIGVIVRDKSIDGVIVQLPLPEHINTQDILNAVTPQKDIDCLSARSVGDFAVGKTKLMPPVVGAIFDLAKEYEINFRGKIIVIAGAGRLVGRPVASWFLRQDIGYTVITEETQNPEKNLERADIIISGVGKKIIDGSMIKNGVIVFDAGTSEGNGVLHGDSDIDSVSKKAFAITPVPGGIGPLTIMWIFKNLLLCIKK